ncbi:hypothetical protein NBRC110019_32140 [Neptunitalea chrysea]|uniref:Uncharacterized protein n=1 Tax=Neptunitalea chrysea TaxID=1647581 RepID=A0A9W6EX13_9FLAO|nr:hypothetical protein [Neptunitalea chrysea]GLB54173.1 hypothetical protein NBRC110019_32140 [Neptunitalea chrysea]
MLGLHTYNPSGIIAKIVVILMLSCSLTNYAQISKTTNTEQKVSGKIPYRDIRKENDDPRVPGILGMKLSRTGNGFIFVYYGNDDKQVADYLIGLQKAISEGHTVRGFIHTNPIKGQGNTFEIFAYGYRVSDFQEIANNYTGDLIAQYIADADLYLIPKLSEPQIEQKAEQPE